jgi:hypothetical protein
MALAYSFGGGRRVNMLRTRSNAAPSNHGGFSETPEGSTCLPSFNVSSTNTPSDKHHTSVMYSARELRNLACNCRSLARQTEAEQVGIFLLQLADDFDHKARMLEPKQEPIGSGRC